MLPFQGKEGLGITIEGVALGYSVLALWAKKMSNLHASRMREGIIN